MSARIESRSPREAAETPCALPGSPLAQASAGLDACVHCGFCLQACPTYVNLEDENDSPRGRIVLMRRMLEGEIAVDDTAAVHIDRCLGCRACETACPSGVPYGELLEATRATMVPYRGIPFIARPILFVFRHHLLLHTALLAAKVFRASGLPRWLARVLPVRLAFPMAMLASTAPSDVIRSIRERAAAHPDGHPSGHAAGHPGGHPAGHAAGHSGGHSGGHVGGHAGSDRTQDVASTSANRPTGSSNASVGAHRTAMLDGCVMSGLFSHVNAATAEALQRNGHTLCSAPGQRCCGALHAHAGDMDGARALARENIAAFERSNADTIVVNAAGCGAMMKQYAHLLHDDPVWADRARRISERTRDVSEALAADGPAPGRLPTSLRVTHDPPCHQMHAQRIIAPPLQVLSAIDGIELVPLEDADQCCGSAGIYNLIEPATSDAVLRPKLQNIVDTRATVLASGNPGCMMQMGAGLLLQGSDIAVVHPVELLAAAYSHVPAASRS